MGVIKRVTVMEHAWEKDARPPTSSVIAGAQRRLCKPPTSSVIAGAQRRLCKPPTSSEITGVQRRLYQSPKCRFWEYRDGLLHCVCFMLELGLHGRSAMY
ncbi:hypothetical protein F2Q70_00008761 [Brassica cretica]|uniref:Uncharacterized protein n=1 Tax=Brassica cretica TaxID=69181 RepID=A0A8S9LZ15_BRACR|nr:hypothetical protein F2Q70_00008761 [Brassica cretica]